MDNIKISIIMPVFNGEQYLRATLDSILCQDLQDFELIAVDDGSTDRSLEILKEYKAQISNMQIITQPNSGVSIARNNGIEAVRGEYFCFCDSDDLLAKNYISSFCKIAEEYQPDVAVCQYSTFYGNADLKPKHNSAVKTIKKDFVTELTDSGLITQIWNKIYRTDLVRANEILMPSSMAYGEDMFFNWQVLLVSKNVVTTDSELYFYRMNQNGASVRYHKDLFLLYKEQYSKIEEFAALHNVDTELVNKQISCNFIDRIPAVLRMNVRGKIGMCRLVKQTKELVRDTKLQEAAQEVLGLGGLKGDRDKISKAIADKNIGFLIWYGIKSEARLKLARLIKGFLKH